MPGERMSGAIAVCDGDAGGEAQACAEGDDTLAHPSLAAAKMRDATQGEPEAVRAGESGPRRPAAGAGEREARKQPGLDIRLRPAAIPIVDEKARLPQRPAPEPPGLK